MNYLQYISKILVLSILTNLVSFSAIGKENKTAKAHDLAKKVHIQERLLLSVIPIQWVYLDGH